MQIIVFSKSEKNKKQIKNDTRKSLENKQQSKTEKDTRKSSCLLKTDGENTIWLKNPVSDGRESE